MASNVIRSIVRADLTLREAESDDVEDYVAAETTPDANARLAFGRFLNDIAG